jgi:hypothetical protein
MFVSSVSTGFLLPRFRLPVFVSVDGSSVGVGSISISILVTGSDCSEEKERLSKEGKK